MVSVDLFTRRFEVLPHGGDEEIRTLDPLLAGQVLSQLSYTPMGWISYLLGFSEEGVILPRCQH